MLFRGSPFIYWPSNIWLGTRLGVLGLFDVIFDSQAYLLFLFSFLFWFISKACFVPPLFLHVRDVAFALWDFRVSSHLICCFLLPKSMAAAAAWILPAASCDDGDSTVGAHAGWCWLNGTLHHLEQTNSDTHTHTQAHSNSAKNPNCLQPNNNSSPAIARVRHCSCSQIWINDTATIVI